MTASTQDSGNRWAGAWPDALAFAFGLGLAWQFNWATRDLVWSLWLSSLVIGYAMIVWSIFGPGVFIATKAWSDRALLADTPKVKLAMGGTALLVGGLLMLGFFTVHFGGFHFVHSVFLNAFFPVDAGQVRAEPGLDLYAEVFRRYWWFLPAAAVAERAAFRFPSDESGEPPDTSVKAADVARRLAKPKQGFTGMMAPYKNVVRLHLLIFFFAAAHFMRLDSFLVYAVVYAVYFFPWRLLQRDKV